jgi:precorrin-6A/cobalt-precorrin-6A reductase
MRLLLLAGTRDSVQIAGALSREHRVAATAAIPRGVRAPVSLGLPTRIGGWGGEAGFRDWLVRERVNAILDTTHPFATAISDRAFRVSDELGIDYIRFLRPSWLPGAEDRWAFLNDCSEVAQKVPEGATILLDTGGRGAERAGPLPGRTVHCRVEPPLPNGAVDGRGWHYLPARARFEAESEMRLYSGLGLDWLVLQNVGGVEERPKLEAARRLGISIGLVRRPPQPEAPRAGTVSEVMHWVRRRL